MTFVDLFLIFTSCCLNRAKKIATPQVKQANTLSVGKFDTYCWARVEPKGDFQNSRGVKEWAESKIDAGAKYIVVDLENCKGMDSTFMGNLAGLAIKLTCTGGELQIVDASDKCVNLLDELGVSVLMNVNPKNTAWSANKDSIRSRLSMLGVCMSGDATSHVYETHKKLCEVDSKNELKFNAVLECLEAEICNKKN
jgi:anti-sigma B factor antagonist